MALNKVQQDFVGTSRVHMEVLVRILHELGVFVADFDAIQAGGDAIPTDSAVLDDAGAAPRADAPELTGAHVKTLRDLSALMSAVVDAPTKEILVGRMVRSLATVLRLN